MRIGLIIKFFSQKFMKSANSYILLIWVWIQYIEFDRDEPIRQKDKIEEWTIYSLTFKMDWM